MAASIRRWRVLEGIARLHSDASSARSTRRKGEQAVNHFALFGTRQVWLYLRQKAYTSLPFRTPWLYRFVRHPLYIGWIIAFWATPTMTAGHLLFAAAMTAYMLIAIPLEERDLKSHFPQEYAAYKQRTGGLIPRLPPCPA